MPMALLFCLGYLMQRCILNLVIRAPMFNTLLITFGLEVVITYLAQMIFSADFRTVNPTYAGAQFRFSRRDRSRWRGFWPSASPWR